MTPTSSAEALANYTSAANSTQSPDQVYQGEEQSLGIPQATQQVSGLRQAITNTTNLLNNVAPSVMGRTANSLVTSAQANRQIGNEQAPIASELKDQTSKETNASSDLNSLLGKASTLADLKVRGNESHLAALKGIYDSLFGKEQADSAAQAEAAKQAEGVREFNVSSNQSQQKINNDAAATKPPPPTPQDIAGVQSDFIKLQGGDGYVSPRTYARAALNWANAGYTLQDFSKNFSKYKDPNNPNYTL